LGADSLPPPLHALALRSVDLVYQEDFDRALETAKRIVRRAPQRPAGYFFCAVVLDSWAGYYQSSDRENEFYRYCEQAIERGEAVLDRDPHDTWGTFFVGGTEGLKGNYESRYERWITAFRNGWKGVSMLLELQERATGINDVNYGIGTYYYWRSAMTKVMFWLPGVEDKRAEGIERLRKSMNHGVYTRQASAANLLDILVNERRYQEAMALADSMLTRYPKALSFWWGKAQALYGLGKWRRATEQFKAILAKVESERLDNHYNAVRCHYWLARIRFAQGLYGKALAECNRMGYYSLSQEIEKRLNKHFDGAAQLKKKAKSRFVRGK
jgi:tetratricopeptide (TPR) repeat protein